MYSIGAEATVIRVLFFAGFWQSDFARFHLIWSRRPWSRPV